MLRRCAVLVLGGMLAGGAVVGAQKTWAPPRVTEPAEALVFTEGVPGSDYPVDVTLLETVDGLFTPIGIRRPKGNGPFPAVLFFSGNGGAGLQQVRDYVYNVAGYTMERFLAEGYVVAWLQYRAEAWFAWPGSTPLRVGKQQANQLMSRPPLEIDDLMTIVDYVKRLPYVDPSRVGVCGNSHGGGMILRALVDGLNVRAAVVSEPDASEFLQMREPAFAVENPIYRTPESIAPVLDKPVAMDRIRRIPQDFPILLVNRDQDELQGAFETVYLWMKEAGRRVERVSYDHPVHGYIVRVKKDEKGLYRPDEIQLKVIRQAIEFFNSHMPR
ncbi:MAG: prolyl oligopeptidase family serine peptidase [Acidobacteriota bacterium]